MGCLTRAILTSAVAGLLAPVAQAQTSDSVVPSNAISSSAHNAFEATKQDVNPLARFLIGTDTEMLLRSGAINASNYLMQAFAANLGQVQLPCGIYRLDTPLTFTVSTPVQGLDGQSPGCVAFNINFTVGDVWTIIGTTRTNLQNFAINYLAQHTSGNTIHLQTTYDAHLDNLTFEGPAAGDAIFVDGANTTRISRIDCRPPGPFGYGLFSAGACIHGSGNFVDLYATNINTASYHYGLELTWGSGFHVYHFDSVRNGSAIQFDPGIATSFTALQSGTTLTVAPGLIGAPIIAGEYLQGSGMSKEGIIAQVTGTAGGAGTYITTVSQTVASQSMTIMQTVWGGEMGDVQADSAAGDNWSFAGTGYVNDVNIGNSWASNSQGGTGIALNNPNLDSIQFTGMDVLDNFGSGVAALQGKNVTFTNAHLCMNSTGGNGSYDGATIGASFGALTFVGGMAGQCGLLSANLGLTNKQRYAINQLTGATALQSVHVIGMTTMGHVISSLNLQPATGQYAGNVNLGNTGN